MYCVARWFAGRGLTPVRVEQAGDLVFSVALGTIIGGRLGYCIFYAPELFTQISWTPPFWGALAINRGGMASHGGMIGIVAAAIWFGRKIKVSPAHLLDLSTLGGTIGVFFGRIANFINGELVGRPAASDLPWAVKFPQDLYQWGPAQLRQISSAAEAAGIKPENWNDWLEHFTYSALSQSEVEAAVTAIISSIQAGNVTVQNLLAPYLTARHPSQLYEAIGEGAFLTTVLLLIWRKPRKPGVICGWFLVLYAIARIIGEQFRMPDPQIGFQIFGTTRGQLLSGLMLAAGMIFLWTSLRRHAAPRYGGWAAITPGPHASAPCAPESKK